MGRRIMIDITNAQWLLIENIQIEILVLVFKSILEYYVYIIVEAIGTYQL